MPVRLLRYVQVLDQQRGNTLKRYDSGFLLHLAYVAFRSYSAATHPHLTTFLQYNVLPLCQLHITRLLFKLKVGNVVEIRKRAITASLVTTRGYVTTP